MVNFHKVSEEMKVYLTLLNANSCRIIFCFKESTTSVEAICELLKGTLLLKVMSGDKLSTHTMIQY